MTKETLRKDIIRDFIKFLKENGIYIRYKANIAHRKVGGFYYAASKIPRKGEIWRETFCNGISEIFDNGTYDSYLNLINYPFCWGCTLEGITFWGKYNSKWKDYFSEKYRKHIRILDYR